MIETLSRGRLPWQQRCTSTMDNIMLHALYMFHSEEGAALTYYCVPAIAIPSTPLFRIVTGATVAHVFIATAALPQYRRDRITFLQLFLSSLFCFFLLLLPLR